MMNMRRITSIVPAIVIGSEGKKYRDYGAHSQKPHTCGKKRQWTSALKDAIRKANDDPAYRAMGRGTVHSTR